MSKNMRKHKSIIDSESRSLELEMDVTTTRSSTYYMLGRLMNVKRVVNRMVMDDRELKCLSIPDGKWEEILEMKSNSDLLRKLLRLVLVYV